MSVLRAAGECSLCKGDGKAAGRARSIEKGLGKLCAAWAWGWRAGQIRLVHGILLIFLEVVYVYFVFKNIFSKNILEEKGWGAGWGTLSWVPFWGEWGSFWAYNWGLIPPSRKGIWRETGFVIIILKNILLKYVDLQCCVNFCYTEKWFSYTHIDSFSCSFPLWFITGYWI